MLKAQALQHIRIGGVAGFCLFAVGQPQLDKERIAELLGGVDIKFVAGLPVDLLLQLAGLLVQGKAEFLDLPAVDGKALSLHFSQYTRQRQLNGLKQLRLALGLNFSAQPFRQGRQQGRLPGLPGLLRLIAGLLERPADPAHSRLRTG